MTAIDPAERGPINWIGLTAPSLDDFEAIAQAAYASLPVEFRQLTGDIIIRVAEFGDDDALDALGIESAFDLLGLFQGIGLAQGVAMPFTGQMPNAIWLYRQPILGYWAEHEETLGHVIAHVLIHEIGHHFGLSDDDMEALEAQAD